MEGEVVVRDVFFAIAKAFIFIHYVPEQSSEEFTIF